MEQVYGEVEIRSLLAKARIFNKQIGSYELYVNTCSQDYIVKLSNGKILLKHKELRADGLDALTPERVRDIAGRYSGEQGATEDPERFLPVGISAPTYKRAMRGLNGVLKFTGSLALMALVVFAITGISAQKKDNMLQAGASYQEKLAAIEETERSEPLDFLIIAARHQEKQSGHRIIAHCIIQNKASIVSYRQLVFKITCYSKTKSILGTSRYIVRDCFAPNSSTMTEINASCFAGSESIGLEIVSAEGE